MRQAFFQHLDNTFNELERFWNPPTPEPAPQVEYVCVSEDEQGVGRLGYRDFNAKLFASPVRWFSR
jgi:hypothetical protein